MDKTYEILTQFTRELADENVKNAFLGNPSQFLNERGFNIPQNVQLELHQNDSQYFYLVFPTSPQEGTLSDEELDSMNAAKNSSSGSASTVLSASTASTFPGCLGSASSIGTAGSKGTG